MSLICPTNGISTLQLQLFGSDTYLVYGGSHLDVYGFEAALVAKLWLFVQMLQKFDVDEASTVRPAASFSVKRFTAITCCCIVQDADANR
jgi:hypothetical protein